MQQSVVQPINSQRGMAAKGGNGQTEFWARRGGKKLKFYHCNKSNKALTHRHERRVEVKQELRFWKEDELLAFEADMKEMKDFFECEEDNGAYDYIDDFSSFDARDSNDAYYAREHMKAQLNDGCDEFDDFDYHNEPYYSGCPICGPLGCILD